MATKLLLICIIINECIQVSTTSQREIELFCLPYKKSQRVAMKRIMTINYNHKKCEIWDNKSANILFFMRLHKKYYGKKLWSDKDCRYMPTYVIHVMIFHSFHIIKSINDRDIKSQWAIHEKTLIGNPIKIEFLIANSWWKHSRK